MSHIVWFAAEVPFCPRELNLHATSALSTLLPARTRYRPTDKKINISNCTERLPSEIHFTVCDKHTVALLDLHCTVDAPHWRALQQTGSFPLRLSSRGMSLKLSPW